MIPESKTVLAKTTSNDLSLTLEEINKYNIILKTQNNSSSIIITLPTGNIKEGSEFKFIKQGRGTVNFEVNNNTILSIGSNVEAGEIDIPSNKFVTFLYADNNWYYNY